MSGQKRLLTTRELAALYPNVFSKSKLDSWARQEPPIGPPFVQPAGRYGARIYDLDAVEEMFSNAANAARAHRSPQQEKATPKPESNSNKSKNKIGFGLAARAPKKRGPSPSAPGGAS